jgi:hypothetical protein
VFRKSEPIVRIPRLSMARSNPAGGLGAAG